MTPSRAVISNPSDAVKRYAQSSPNTLAFLNTHQSISYGQLDRFVDMAGSYIWECNIAQGETIAHLFGDQLKILIFSLALIRYGYPQIMLQPSQNPHAWEPALADAAVLHVITDKEIQYSSGISTHSVPGLAEFAQNGSIDLSLQPVKWENNKPILGFQGSGTTGLPRTIWHGAGGLFSMIERDIQARPIVARDRHLSLSRLNYFTALRRTFAALASFGVATTIDSITPSHQIINFCNRFAIDHLSMVNVHAQTLLDALSGHSLVFPDLKSLMIGSSPISERTRKMITTTFTTKLYVGYGTNEFGEATVLDYSGNPTANADSIGYPCQGVDVRIVDRSGRAMAAGEVGEIQLRAKFGFLGYGNRNDCQGGNHSDGWFQTKDLGWMSERGEIMFSGRADDMMIFNGINIYPREIESVLETHPDVIEVAALPFASSIHGDVPIAFVVPSDARPETSALLRYAVGRLGTKAPKKIFLVSELPKNAAGKVLKRKLKELLMSQLNNA